MVVGISPVLVMLLVGSLSFFLIQVFYRGEALGSVRWVLFWFVLAVVLVSRIGIEQGAGHAVGYGLALAAATWLYLVRIHPAYFLGIALLGTIWWCAHKLTWDCTLIDEDVDASGSGLLQTASERGRLKKQETLSKPAEKKAATRAFAKGTFRMGGDALCASTAARSAALPDAEMKYVNHSSAGFKHNRKRPAPAPHPPGLWVVYFSLIALPLFGVGQMLLPGNDARSRRIGFVFLFTYMAAALGLLLTTSFLGLRRYLRQRYLKMPGIIALGWIKFGAGVALVVLVAALLLPRPGVNDTWQTLHYQIDYQLRRASEYAARISPHGKGRGRPGNETKTADQSRERGATARAEDGSERTAGDRQPGQTPAGQEARAQERASQAQSSRPMFAERASEFYGWFKGLFLLAGAILAGGWLIRRRDLIFQIVRSFCSALARFFRDLFQFASVVKKTTATGQKPTPKQHPFASYKNPFITGKDRSWTPEQVIFYSFEAVQMWASERGIVPRPEQTAREFCLELGEKFPQIDAELARLAFFYGHAAYGTALPRGCDLEPVKQLWRYLLGQEASIASNP
jgi:hypothetical protein